MKVHVRSKTCYTLAMSSNSNDFPMLPECGCGWGWGGEEVTSWSTAGSREGGVEEGWSEIVEGGGDGPADNTNSHLNVNIPYAKLTCHTYSFVPLLVDWVVFATQIMMSHIKSHIKLQFEWIQRIVNAQKQVEKLKSNHTWFHSMCYDNTIRSIIHFKTVWV